VRDHEVPTYSSPAFWRFQAAGSEPRLLSVPTCHAPRSHHKFVAKINLRAPILRMSIYVAYRKCVQSSRELCDSLRAQGPEAIPTSLRNDIGRFTVWAKNSGAHRKETHSMSLDYRLREASDVKNMVVKLLEDLKAALQDGRYIAHSGRQSWI
jgi:hypothetical protein